MEAQYHFTRVFVSLLQCHKPKVSVKFILREFESHREIQNML